MQFLYPFCEKIDLNFCFFPSWIKISVPNKPENITQQQRVRSPLGVAAQNEAA